MSFDFKYTDIQPHHYVNYDQEDSIIFVLDFRSVMNDIFSLNNNYILGTKSKHILLIKILFAMGFECSEISKFIGVSGKTIRRNLKRFDESIKALSLSTENKSTN